MMFSRSWDPRGKNCYVTGGSAGLGLSLALLLTRSGANVAIVARNQNKLQNAVNELQKARVSPNQVIAAHSFSLTKAKPSEDALEAVTQSFGGSLPDAAFLCAGAATPGFFVEQSGDDLGRGMDNAYWVQAYSALAFAKRAAHVNDKKNRKLVFVCSTLGYMSIVGYSSYAPGKHALRGLAETLRSELLLYSVSVHIYFPGNIDSPGYAEENKTKPKITLKIEESDRPIPSAQVAAGLLKGVQRGDFHITMDFIGNIFRSSTRGSSPHNNVFLDAIYSFIGWVALPVWRRSVDSAVSKHQSEHEEYLRSKGFFSNSAAAST
ncbi:3-dehydrosphinganine reductase [Stygiomarasmius scandens]|uniref:3-dehydrosphinganine reductase n=1 Tax=Marasmiellus scandens TaxID=2682957 RepID=A0ABR1K1X3_9AGAR